jgi:hypothetical protein
MGRNPCGRPTRTVCVASAAQRRWGTPRGWPTSLATRHAGHARHLPWRDDGAQSARRGVGGDGQRLDSWQEGEHRHHPWTTTHPPDKAMDPGMDRGGGTTMWWQLTGAAPMLRLVGGEGASSSGWGATPKLGEAPGSAQGSGKALSHTVHGGRRWRRTGKETVTHQSGQGDLGADELQ